MAINVKQIATDVVTVGGAVSAILAVLVNVAHSVSLPAPDVAIIVGVASVVTAIVNVLKPYVASSVKSLFKPKPAS